MINGIFSKGFGELFKYFTKIYCTNSYSDLSNYEFDNEGSIELYKFVKQLNIL